MWWVKIESYAKAYIMTLSFSWHVERQNESDCSIAVFAEFLCYNTLVLRVQYVVMQAVIR